MQLQEEQVSMLSHDKDGDCQEMRSQLVTQTSAEIDSCHTVAIYVFVAILGDGEIWNSWNCLTFSIALFAAGTG